jgi:hypothetical protein
MLQHASDEIRMLPVVVAMVPPPEPLALKLPLVLLRT